MTLSDWAKERPLHALGSSLWILLNIALGAAAGGTLAWGPLAGGPALQLALAVALALMAAALAVQPVAASVRGRDESARGWRRGLAAAHLAIFLGVGSLAVGQLYRSGFFPPVGQSYVENFDHLGRALAETYPYFALKGVNWQALQGQYRPQAAAAETDAEYYAVVAEILAQLNDAHSGLMQPYLPGGSFAHTREIDGQAVVTRSSLAGQAAGLERGAVVRSVGGVSVAERISQLGDLDPRLVTGSTARQRRARAFLNLLWVPREGPLEVTFEAPDGAVHAHTLSWANAPENPYANYPQHVTGVLLPSGAALVYIPTFAKGEDRDPAAEFDALLAQFMDAPGLIIDLRDNGGGASFVAEAIDGRLLPEAFAYGTEWYRTPLPRFGWRTEREARVRPRGESYDGPLVLLIDTLNMSTAETFIVSLTDSGQAQTVGRHTAGASGNPAAFRLVGGGRARYSQGSFTRPDGTPLEGEGIAPDVAVTWTLEDVRAGHDPDVAAAEALLGLGP